MNIRTEPIALLGVALVLCATATYSHAAARPLDIELPGGPLSLTSVETDKNTGEAEKAQQDSTHGYLRYMSTALNKGLHLSQAVGSIRAINVTAAAALQAAAALPASQSAAADMLSDVFTSNMGNYLSYHGGKMMTQPDTLNIYILWYGKWSDKQKTIIRNFILSMDKTHNKFDSKYPTVVGWWAINVRYYPNAKKQKSTPFVSLKQELDDDYSFKPLGTAMNPLSHDQVRLVLASALDSKRKGGFFPTDQTGAYLVLTAPDVYVTDFCNGLCAYHTSAEFNGKKLAYTFVGNPASQCPRYCSYQYYDPTFKGVNGDLGADAVADKIGHELSEVVTNPLHGPNDTPGWVVAGSQIENADLCEWLYGPTNYEGIGGVWNVKGINGTKYLVQLNFNRRKKACALQGDNTVLAGSIMGGVH